MTTDRMREAIARLSTDGKVNCAALLALAKEAGVEPKQLGDLCNKMGIHISNCQLGCFQ